MMTLPRLFTIAEVADYARCGRSTIERAIERGDLRATLVGARKVKRITETAVLEWLGEPTEADPTPPRGIARPAVGL